MEPELQIQEVEITDHNDIPIDIIITWIDEYINASTSHISPIASDREFND